MHFAYLFLFLIFLKVALCARKHSSAEVFLPNGSLGFSDVNDRGFTYASQPGAELSRLCTGLETVIPIQRLPTYGLGLSRETTTAGVQHRFLRPSKSTIVDHHLVTCSYHYTRVFGRF